MWPLQENENSSAISVRSFPDTIRSCSGCQVGKATCEQACTRLERDDSLDMVVADSPTLAFRDRTCRRLCSCRVSDEAGKREACRDDARIVKECSAAEGIPFPTFHLDRMTSVLCTQRSKLEQWRPAGSRLSTSHARRSGNPVRPDTYCEYESNRKKSELRDCCHVCAGSCRGL